MTTCYQLLDLEAGNIFGAYPDEQTALAAVRQGIAEDGADLWRNVALFWSDEDTTTIHAIAEGVALIAMALSTQEAASSTADVALIGSQA